jgi:hypothetical protein
VLDISDQGGFYYGTEDSSIWLRVSGTDEGRRLRAA